MAAALTNLVVGFLTDRVSLRYLLVLGLLLQAVSLLMAQYLQGAGTAFLFGTILGATNGVSRAVGTVVWPSYFGRENLGSILGFTAATGVVGAAFGPLPFGFVHDTVGSYQPVLFASAAVCVLLCVAGLTVRKPKKSQVAERV